MQGPIAPAITLPMAVKGKPLCSWHAVRFQDSGSCRWMSGREVYRTSPGTKLGGQVVVVVRLLFHRESCNHRGQWSALWTIVSSSCGSALMADVFLHRVLSERGKVWGAGHVFSKSCHSSDDHFRVLQSLEKLSLRLYPDFISLSSPCDRSPRKTGLYGRSRKPIIYQICKECALTALSPVEMLV